LGVATGLSGLLLLLAFVPAVSTKAFSVMPWRLWSVALALTAFLFSRPWLKPRGHIARSGGLHISFTIILCILLDDLQASTYRDSGVTAPPEPAIGDVFIRAGLAPIVEELAFRLGIMLGLITALTLLGLSRLFAASTGVIWPSFLFGLVHSSSSTLDVIIPTALGGLFFAGAYLISGSIMAAIGAHVVNNLQALAPLAVRQGISVVLTVAVVAGLLIHIRDYRHRSFHGVIQSLLARDAKERVRHSSSSATS